MSGHSKWATIRRKKEITDSRRGQMFTKLGREITTAAKEGGASVDTNFRLRLAVQKARIESMPSENIDRAIARGAGASAEGSNYEEITYEGYGPVGSAIIIQALTDNRNRTVGEIRAAMSRSGGNLGENGSVIWMFKSQGMIAIEPEKYSVDEIELAAIEAGADDVQSDEEDNVIVYVPLAGLRATTESLNAAGFKVTSSERTMTPTTTMELDANDTAKVMRLVEKLEELDDVQQVYTNLEFTEAAMAGLE